MPGSDDYADSAPGLGVDPSWFANPTSNAPQGSRDANIDNLTRKILQQDSYSKWTGQAFGTVYNNARHMATRLADAGITRLEDFGKRTVETQQYYSDDSGSGYHTVQKPEFYNKATGQLIRGDVQNGNTFDLTYAGDGSTQFNVTFNNMGMPIFYTQYNGSSSDWGMFQPILTLASIIPSPVQPFAQAINAVAAYRQGNEVGAVLGALGAAYSFGAQYGTIDPSSAAYINSMDAASDVAAGATTSTFTSAANWLASNAGNIQTAQQAAVLLNALDKKNLAGVIAGIVQISPQVGVTIPESAVKPIQTAALASAVGKGDWVGASMIGSSLFNSSDLRLAGKGIQVADAVKSGNPIAMLDSVIDFNQTYRMIDASKLRTAAKQVGLPMSDQEAESLLTSQNPRASLRSYEAAINDARRVFKSETGQDLPDDFFENNQRGNFLSKADDLFTTKDEARDLWRREFGYDPFGEDIKDIVGLQAQDADNFVRLTSGQINRTLDVFDEDQRKDAFASLRSGKIKVADASGYTPLDWLKSGAVSEDLDSPDTIVIRGQREQEFPEMVITGSRDPGWQHSVDPRGYTIMWNEGRGLIQLYDENDNLLHNWTDQFKRDRNGNLINRGFDYYLSAMKDSLIRSGYQTAALIGDVLPAMAAKAIGNESYFKKQMADAKATLDKVNREYPSRVASYKNINDISSAATYVLESVMEGVVTTAPSLLMGGAAGVAARASAKAAMDAAIKKELATQASKGVFGQQAIAAAQTAATKAGLEVAAKFTTPAILASSAAQNIPEVFKNVYDAKSGNVDLKDLAVSTLVGSFNAALDSVLPSAIVDRLNLSKIPVEQVIGAWYKNAAKEAGGAFLKESGTETLQEMSSAAAETFLAQNKDFFTKENLDRFIDAGLKGGLGGSAVSTGFTLGRDAAGALSGQDIVEQGLDRTTPAEYLAATQMFKDAGFNATLKDVSAITGAAAETLGPDLRSALDSYMDPRVVSEEEARQELLNLGYSDPTQDEVTAFVGQRDEASSLAALREQYDPLATTPEEAQQMMRDLGYTNLTNAEAQALAGKIKEEEARANVQAYVDPRMVTREEAEQFYRSIGYTPTEEEIVQFVRQGADVSQQGVQSELGSYVDPRMVDEQEVRDALESLGFPDATDAQVKSLAGQYAEAKLAGLAQENLPRFIYGALKEQNAKLQQQIGTQGRAVAQSDVDALSQMLQGQRDVDLAYDVTGDKQITQADVNYLQNLIANNQTQWTAPVGSPWAPTGLYGDLAAAEAQRKADMAAAEQQRQADIAAQQEAAKEAERRSAIRTAAGTAQAQTQALIGQLPQAYKAMQQTTTPIYAGEMKEFDLGAPLDVGFFDVRKEAQGGQKQQQTTKIATGGYLDDLLDLLR